MALGACALAMVAGCTFLIDFQDVPPEGDGGTVDNQVPIGPPDVRVDANLGDAAIDTGPDARDAIADPDACKGHQDGKYCGGDQITWPGSKDDLVTCKTGKVSVVKYCPTGQGCIQMLDGHPDECDVCAQKGDGTFCGRDMPGWATPDAENGHFLIRCQTGRVVTSKLCFTCKSAGINSACQ
jgi:hypothetical protein